MRYTGEVLKELMVKKGLRQIDIVNLCKPFCTKYNVRLGKEDINQYINKNVRPNQDRIAILALALNVDEAYLMGYDIEPTRTNASLVQELYEQLTPDDQEEIIELMRYKISKKKGTGAKETASA